MTTPSTPSTGTEKAKEFGRRFAMELVETLVDPIRAIIETIERGPKAQRGENFDKTKMDQIAEGIEATDQSVEMQRAVEKLNLALKLVSLFKQGSTKANADFFSEHGIANFLSLPNVTEMQDVEDGALVKAVNKALSEIGEERLDELEWLFKDGPVDYGVLSDRMMKWYSGGNSPEAREFINERLDAIIKAFQKEYEGSADLQVFLQTAVDQMNAHEKTTSDDETEEQKAKREALLEQHEKYIERLMTRRGPEWKEKLHQLFSIQSLDENRAIAFVRSDEGKALVAELRATGEDIDAIFAEEGLNGFNKWLEKLAKLDANQPAAVLVHKVAVIEGAIAQLDAELDDQEKRDIANYIRTIKQAAEANKTVADVEDELEAIEGLLVDRGNENLSDYLANYFISSVIGRKEARELGVEYKAVKTALDSKIKPLFDILLHRYPNGASASSVKDLVEQMANDPSLSVAGDYEEIITLGNEAYERIKTPNQNIFEALSAAFNKGTGTAKKQTNEAVKELKKSKEYRDTIATFDFLTAVVQGRVQRPSSKNLGNSFDSKVRAVRDAYGNPAAEGFAIDYTQNMPGVSPADCDFGQMPKNKPFSFEKLMELYSQGITDPALIDVPAELQSVVANSIGVELGVPIQSADTYTNNTEMPAMYVNQEDFDLAKSIREALADLMGMGLSIETPEEEVVEEEGEKKVEPTEASLKIGKRIVKRTLALGKQKTKEEAERKAKAEAEANKKKD